MCLYPKKTINKKYTDTAKNGGNIPSPPVIGYNEQTGNIYDKRVLTIEVPCGQCIECREQKAREWQVRLSEEIKVHKYNYFITLTFAPKELEEICKKTRLNECNAVAGYAVRHMLERWRKDHKKSIKHWLITELGHEGTERIHMHGILFTDEVLEFGEVDNNNLRTWKYWKYGHIYVGEYVNQRTINYISKYITKIDTDHKGFVGQILASPGIGKNFLERIKGTTEYKYLRRQATDFYRLANGCKVKLPTYYKNHIYTEEQREEIWRDFMDKEKLSILSTSYSTKLLDKNTLDNIKDNAKEISKTTGYGDDSGEWKKKDYNVTRRMLQQVERQKRIDEMRSTLILNYTTRVGKVTQEEVFEMRKSGLKGEEIEMITLARGRNF